MTDSLLKEILAQLGSGFVYCSTRKQAENLHEGLSKKGVKSVLYHAGLDDDARRSIHFERLGDDLFCCEAAKVESDSAAKRCDGEKNQCGDESFVCGEHFHSFWMERRIFLMRRS